MAKLDLNMELREEPDGIRGFLEYNADLFDRSTADRLARQLANLAWAGLRAGHADSPRPLPPRGDAGTR